MLGGVGGAALVAVPGGSPRGQGPLGPEGSTITARPQPVGPREGSGEPQHKGAAKGPCF